MIRFLKDKKTQEIGGLKWISSLKLFFNPKTQRKNNKDKRHNYFCPDSLLSKLRQVHPLE